MLTTSTCELQWRYSRSWPVQTFLEGHPDAEWPRPSEGPSRHHKLHLVGSVGYCITNATRREFINKVLASALENCSQSSHHPSSPLNRPPFPSYAAFSLELRVPQPCPQQRSGRKRSLITTALVRMMERKAMHPRTQY